MRDPGNEVGVRPGPSLSVCLEEVNLLGVAHGTG